LANLVDLPDPAREARVGAAGWKALFGAEPELPDGARTELAAWAERMADLLSPSLADHLLAPAQSRFGPLLGAERIAKGQLYSRFLLQRQLGAVRMLRDAGIRFVCLKGFALAHLLYPRPELRIVGDVDLLLNRAELRKATAALAAAGFKAMPIPNRFGFISDSSFLPLVSEDGQVALDLHLAPDAWPAGRALTAEAVFARAARFRAGDLELLGPAPEHAFFLLVTNTAKDRFGPEGVRKLVDAAMLLRACPGLDWAELRELAERGGYARSLSAFHRLLDLLGLQRALQGRGLRRLSRRNLKEIEQVAALYRTARVAQLGFYGKLRREFLLGPGPQNVLRINLKRLRGLLRPGSGVPPGMAQRRQRGGQG
jgi:hypothetical protein